MTSSERAAIKLLVSERRRLLAADDDMNSVFRNCPHCGNEFEARQPRQKFCTDRHRRNYNNALWHRRLRAEARAA